MLLQLCSLIPAIMGFIYTSPIPNGCFIADLNTGCYISQIIISENIHKVEANCFDDYYIINGEIINIE